MDTNLAIPPEIMADLEAVTRHATGGGVRDSELLRRITERAEKVREELRRKHGTLDVAGELVREIREEE